MFKNPSKGSLISSLLIDEGQEASKLADQEGKENRKNKEGLKKSTSALGLFLTLSDMPDIYQYISSF